MKNNLTSSERRGVIAVAVISLLITACALLVGRCGGREAESTFPEPEILMQPEQPASAQAGDSSGVSGKRPRKSGRGKKKQQKDSMARKAARHSKEWGRRSPLDEINGKK